MGFGIVGHVSCIDHEAAQQRISNLVSAIVGVYHVGYLVVASVPACKPPARPRTGTRSRPFQAHCSIVAFLA
ncbi:hypothetical protein Tco_0329574, partial [Tanacetum coccineum]